MAFRLAVISALLVFSFPSVTFAQAPSSAPTAPTATPTVTPGKKVRSASKKSASAAKDAPAKAENAGAAETSSSPTPPWLLPDWSPDALDWGVAPVLGLRITREDGGTLSQTEGGVLVQARGIPLSGQNPGATLAPSAGFALGYAAWTPDSGRSDSGLYQRAWGGADIPFLFKFYKHTLGVQYGDLWGKVIATAKSLTLTSDSAVLVLPFLSAHYTYTRDASFGHSLDHKVALVHDNWWHLRFFTSLLSSFVDFGPGYEIPYLYLQPDNGSATVHGSTTYFLARAGADVIPRFLSADVESRYAFRSDDTMASFAAGRRPGEDLSAPPSRLGQPADSLVASAFVGWKNLIGGVGLGYRYSVEIQHFSEKEGQKQDVRSSQGFGLHVSHAF